MTQVKEYAARGTGAAPDRAHRHALSPRPTAEPPDRRRRDRVRTSVGGSRARRAVGSRATRCSMGVCGRSPTACKVGTALLHLGGVRFPISGPIRYTMTAREAVDLCRLLEPHTVVPIHYEGWKHFREGREAIEGAIGHPIPVLPRLGLLDAEAPVCALLLERGRLHFQ